MKFRRIKKGDFLLLLLIVLMVLPQTRQPIQIAFHSVLSSFAPSVINNEEQKRILFESWRLRDLDGNEFNFNNSNNAQHGIQIRLHTPPCVDILPIWRGV